MMPNLTERHEITGLFSSCTSVQLEISYLPLPLCKSTSSTAEFTRSSPEEHSTHLDVRQGKVCHPWGTKGSDSIPAAREGHVCISSHSRGCTAACCHWYRIKENACELLGVHIRMKSYRKVALFQDQPLVNTLFIPCTI